MPIITHCDHDQSFIGNVLLQINGRDLHDDPISQSELDDLLRFECQLRYVSRDDYRQYYQPQAIHHLSSRRLSHQQQNYVPMLLQASHDRLCPRPISHAIVKSVPLSLFREGRVSRGDILWKIGGFETSTITNDELQQLLQITPMTECSFLQRPKYDRVMNRQKTFRLISQEWDYGNPCLYCGHIYLKGENSLTSLPL
jgi:hypothetical protein